MPGTIGLSDWLETFEREGLLKKQGNNKSKIHNLISGVGFSSFEFREALCCLSDFLMEGAQLAKQASIDNSYTSSNERVSNSIILKKQRVMNYPLSAKKTLPVQMTPTVHNNPFVTSRHFETLKEWPHSIFIIMGQCPIHSSVKNMEQWEDTDWWTSKDHEPRTVGSKEFSLCI